LQMTTAILITIPVNRYVTFKLPIEFHKFFAVMAPHFIFCKPFSDLRNLFVFIKFVSQLIDGNFFIEI